MCPCWLFVDRRKQIHIRDNKLVILGFTRYENQRTVYILAQFCSPIFQSGIRFLTALLCGLKKRNKVNHKINKDKGKETQDWDPRRNTEFPWVIVQGKALCTPA